MLQLMLQLGKTRTGVPFSKVDKPWGRSLSHVPKPSKSPDEEEMDHNSACSPSSPALSKSR